MPTERPPSLTRLTTYLAIQVGRIGYRPYERALAQRGLTLAHNAILIALDDFGPLSQQQLSDHLRAQKSHLVPRINHVEQLGLARRGGDATDRRRRIVTLTEEGEALLRSLEPIVSGAQNALLAPLSAAERATLLTLLGRVLASADAEEPA